MKRKIEVFLLDLGTLYAKRESIVCRGCPQDQSRIDLPVMAVLVRHRDGILLFDTGCRADAMDGGWPEPMQQAFPLTRSSEQTLEHQLKYKKQVQNPEQLTQELKICADLSAELDARMDAVRRQVQK